MPKGNKNIVHDEQIWRDHIKVCLVRESFTWGVPGAPVLGYDRKSKTRYSRSAAVSALCPYRKFNLLVLISNNKLLLFFNFTIFNFKCVVVYVYHWYTVPGLGRIAPNIFCLF